MLPGEDIRLKGSRLNDFSTMALMFDSAGPWGFPPHGPRSPVGAVPGRRLGP